ncbi:hypothetical protein Acsp06_24820 [Actinomycetospora sp. NBRC 106375]|uniref:hypothetical protein n=1 Tax=Actinomycetospora sp. NBRC 106375 TaxID=3032207 RepID=UPI0024A11006|nr:hypothetical protein [Actinomycetospora sp. NBRC 106375]GLZ46297.1 hypothetical protein Acsp06_24820 [Actinomycetospora sp. NBRC 106375]
MTHAGTEGRPLGPRPRKSIFRDDAADFEQPDALTVVEPVAVTDPTTGHDPSGRSIFRPGPESHDGATP